MQEFRELTVEELKSEIQTLKQIKEAVDVQEEILDKIKKEFDIKKTEILACLQRNGLDNFRVPGSLLVSVRNEFTVKQPQSAEAEEAFNAWIAEEGLEKLRKVNSQTLNALYRERLEAAAEQGEIVVIPGLEPPTTTTKLSIRKA